MSFIITADGDGKFPQPPAGKYQAVHCNIIDLGNRPNPFGETKRRFGLEYQLSARTESGKRYRITKWMNVSANERSSMVAFLSDWLDRDSNTLRRELKNGLDVGALIGTNALLRVVQETGKAGDLISKIKSIEPWDETHGALMQIEDTDNGGSGNSNSYSGDELPDDDPFTDEV
jgi:hypothetical protein